VKLRRAVWAKITATSEQLCRYCFGVPHPTEHELSEPLSGEEAETLAEAMRAFGTASRLRLLWAMRAEERTVEELVAETGMSSSAASHQLRLLRQARLVAVRRAGRNAFYRLYDHHVSDLLTAIRSHHDHTHLAQQPTPADLGLSQTGPETRS
jgi:DNA-binding transcriptional ArsR family regulator